MAGTVENAGAPRRNARTQCQPWQCCQGSLRPSIGGFCHGVTSRIITNSILNRPGAFTACRIPGTRTDCGRLSNLDGRPGFPGRSLRPTTRSKRSTNVALGRISALSDVAMGISSPNSPCDQTRARTSYVPCSYVSQATATRPSDAVANAGTSPRLPDLVVRALRRSVHLGWLQGPVKPRRPHPRPAFRKRVTGVVFGALRREPSP